MPLLNWSSVDDFITCTSLGNAFHLQMSSGMNDFLKISNLHFGTIYFSSFRLSYCTFFSFEHWQSYHIGIESLC